MSRPDDKEALLDHTVEQMAGRSRSRSLKSALAAFLLFSLISITLLLRYYNARPSEIIETTERHPFKLNPKLHTTRPPTTLRQHWQVTLDKQRPDGVLKEVFLINGAFPGPTIEARSGDRIIIEIENGLVDTNQSVAMHWHGLTMQNANDMDGAAGVTQDAIPAGHKFVYDFSISAEQSGTFWYHAHSAVQRADGLFGGLVVHDPSEPESLPENDHLLMIGDWYHRQGGELLKWYLSADSFGMEPLPDSILVNGRGSFNCDDAVPARPLNCEQTGSSPILNGLSSSAGPTRLRFVNTGVYSGLTISLPHCPAEIVALDGGNSVDSNPSSTSFGVLHAGERVDVLLHDTPSSLIIELDKTPYKYQNPALTWRQQFSLTDESMAVDQFELTVLNLDELTSSTVVPEEPDEIMLLYVVSEKLAHLDYVPHGSINRTSWLPQKPALNGLDRSAWDDHQFVPQVASATTQPRWIDLIVNNLDEEDHPFHLHGHDFFVMSTYSSTYNWGSWNPYKTTEAPGGAYSTTPRRKDTVAIPRRGYAVLRFKADNPGLWMFHCHVLWHLASGMAMTLDIR